MLVKSSKDIASDEEVTKLNDIYVNTLGIKIRDESIELRIKD